MLRPLALCGVVAVGSCSRGPAERSYLAEPSGTKTTMSVGKRDAAPPGDSRTPGSAPGAPQTSSSQLQPDAAEGPAPGARRAVSTQAVISQSVIIGKWPEQVTVVGDSAWVACSGARVVTEVDLTTGRIVRSVKTGRFPVSLASWGKTVFSVDYNSGQGLFTIATDGKVKLVGRVPDHPESMAADDEAVYVLLWKNGSSEGSSVVRVEPHNYQQKRSADLGRDAMGLAASAGKIWVATNSGLSAIDRTTLTEMQHVDVGVATRRAAANRSAAYTLGVGGESLFRVDAASYEVTRTSIGEWAALLANDEYVYSLGQSGTLRIHDARTLELCAELALGARMEPREMAFYGKKLLVTEHLENDQGRLDTIELR